MNPNTIPVFILAGGLGTRISEETNSKPKPMIDIGGKPMLLHIIEYYCKFGFNEFIVCTGFKGWQINEYFSRYFVRNHDIGIDLISGNIVVHSTDENRLDCKITCCFTGLESQTGSRLKQACNKYLGDRKVFALTYGDGLTNANLADELKSHLACGKKSTVLAVNPPSRFGEFKMDDATHKLKFNEKPHSFNTFINGGYFFFNREVLELLGDEPDLILEQTPLASLANQEEINPFMHTGFWHCMDTLRDKIYLEQLIKDGHAPWIL